jgi:Ankyrin repeats (many copies)
MGGFAAVNVVDSFQPIAPFHIGRTSLHSGSTSDHLDAPVKINGDDQLHRASVKDKLKVLRYCVEQWGTNNNAVITNVSTTLHSAIVDGRLEVVRYLVEMTEAEVHAVINNDTTPLHDTGERSNMAFILWV